MDRRWDSLQEGMCREESRFQSEGTSPDPNIVLLEKTQSSRSRLQSYDIDRTVNNTMYLFSDVHGHA